MNEFLKKIGNIFSAILLGDLRDLIIRTDEAVKRIDKDFDDVKSDVKSIDRRVGRIEGKLGLASIIGGSPLRLTETGKEILEKSGIKEMADQFKPQLLQKIQEQNPKTAYDVQEITKQAFQNFDFGEENVKKLKNYSFQSGKWGLTDILEVGAIYFRDIALQEIRFKVEELDNP